MFDSIKQNQILIQTDYLQQESPINHDNDEEVDFDYSITDRGNHE